MTGTKNDYCVRCLKELDGPDTGAPRRCYECEATFEGRKVIQIAIDPGYHRIVALADDGTIWAKTADWVDGARGSGWIQVKGPPKV